MSEKQSSTEACVGFVEDGTVWQCLKTRRSHQSKGTLYTAKVNHFTSFGVIFSFSSLESCSEQMTLLYIAVALVGALVIVNILIGILFVYNDAFNGFVHNRFGVSMKKADEILEKMKANDSV